MNSREYPCVSRKYKYYLQAYELQCLNEIISVLTIKRVIKATDE